MVKHNWRGWAAAAAVFILGSVRAEAGVIAWASAEDNYRNLSAAISTTENPALANASRVAAVAGGDPWGQAAWQFVPYSPYAAYFGSVPDVPFARATADGAEGVLRLRLRGDSYDGIQSPASGGASLTDTLRFLPSGNQTVVPFLLELDLDYDSHIDDALSRLRVMAIIDRPNDPDHLNPVAGAGYMMRHLYDSEEEAAQLIEFNCGGPCPPENVPNSLHRRVVFSQIFYAPAGEDLPLTIEMVGNVMGMAMLDAESSAWLRIMALEGATYESLSGYSYNGRPEGPVAGEVPEPGTAGLAVAGAALLAALGRCLPARGSRKA